MQYRVLGKLEVSRDGVAVDVGTYRQKSLLAFLLTTPNKIVSTDQIIDALWGEEAGSDKQNALWVHISAVRKLLEPAREKRSGGTILLTRAPGYLLQLDPQDVDALRFEEMAAEGRALADTDPAAASLVLGEALALWRGHAYEDFMYEAFASAEIARLEELRLETVEARIDADLRRGMAGELVSELESLIRQYPMRERFTGQAMLALYRSGRQAEALRRYQFLKSWLGEELGIEPSSQIRKLEEQIVTGDPALEPATTMQVPGSGPQPGLAVRGYELRDKLGENASVVVYRAYQPAVGREVAIKMIRPELADSPAFIRAFEAEAQLVARLSHPHIVPLYDYWREPGAAYLVMRLIKRGTLLDIIDSSALNAAAAVKVIEQISGALHAAHRAGVAHGDIKPQNILIDSAGNAFLSDFAIAHGAGGGDGKRERILEPPYASPEQLATNEASPVGDIYSFAVVMAQALTGLRGEPAQVLGALPAAVARVIEKATDPDPAARYGDVEAFAQDAVRELTGGEEVPEPVELGEVENPYMGLRPFDQTDSALFFGRDRLVTRLVTRLGEHGQRSRFVAVVGPSGSGKSSVVKAGLLPALRQGALPGSDDWFVVDMTPAPHPFEELESALTRVAVDPPSTLLEQLAGAESGLRRVVRQLLPEGSQLLLVVDQFEELFTQVSDETADRFIDALVDAVSDPHSIVRIVITLRADFYDRPLRHRGLGELLRDGTEVITPMSPEELEQAITRPAAMVGVAFEPALVAQLVADVVDRPGALPLMQFTLTELFDNRASATVPFADYQAVRGVSGALVARADGLLAGLSPTTQDAARQVFLRLVTLGEGAEDTRRRVLETELHQLPVDSKNLAQILEVFGRHRLLSFDRDPITRGPTVEISHEALLTQWKRLRDWIDEARHDVRSQRRLALAMTEWVGAGRSADYLLRGGQLDQLAGWAAVTSLPLSGPEGEFLESSLEERDRAEREQREQKERATEAERSAKQRLRLLSVVGAAAVIVAVLAVFAFVQRQAARDSEAEAVTAHGETQVALDRAVVAEAEAVAAEATVERSRRAYALASEANLSLHEDPELSLILAVEAARATSVDGFATHEAVDALHWAIQENGIVYPVDNTTSVAVRSGPRGLRGVFAIPPTELAAIAAGATNRVFSEEECARLFPNETCPDPGDALPGELTIDGGDASYGVTENVPGALAGTTVEFSGAWDPGEVWHEWDRFFTETGIYVSYVEPAPGVEAARREFEGLTPPDILTNGQPGGVVYSGELGRILDLSSLHDTARLQEAFGPYLLELVTVASDGTWPAPSGSVYGIPIEIDLKGLVFYPRSEFESAGYQVPETWDELIELSSRIVADGRTPWCIGFESGGPSDGWPGTDWFESLMVREAGPSAYDDWAAHRVPFDNEAVRSAGERFDQLVSTPGFVWLGKERISQLHFMFDLVPELEKAEPSCWMYHQGDFALSVFSAGTEFGRDIDFFVLPPIDPSRPTPVLGGGNYVTARTDRPEVRAMLEHLASPRWGEVWARQPDSGFISPNASFDVSHYGADAGESERAVRVALGTAARDAIAAGVWRFDASDLMPPDIGSHAAEGPGAFWQGMLDFVDGVRTMDQVLSDIEAAWVALEQEGGG
jgi:DNA-binding SARP family transcriptional activator/ABC-type glycerol-3-phosphate transport system substrate-binding protein/tRNA A-37 threonylcarbamoyl transferase component Bud32